MTAAVRNAVPLHTPPAMGRAAGALLLAALLGGCGVVSDNTASNLLVTPRKYQFHNCQLLTGTLTGQRKRIDELEKLMARASQGPLGQVIGAAAYRNEYLQARGEEKEILAMMREKNCAVESPSKSELSMY